MYFEKIVPILQLAIGPVIIISGVGLLLLSMTNRFGRIIDRSRILAESAENDSVNIKHHIKEQMIILMQRARLLRLAIAFISLSLLFDALLIIALFLFALINFEGTIIIISLFIGCMASLIVGLLYFIVDINSSLSALKLETNINGTAVNK
jgi:hypothetical protein